jgi:hypothetical protein
MGVMLFLKLFHVTFESIKDITGMATSDFIDGNMRNASCTIFMYFKALVLPSIKIIETICYILIL